MKKIIIVQMIVFLVISSSLGGMLFFTDIYEDIQSKIVETICLSCAKLDTNLPVEFTFDTANGQPHPDFVVDTLKTKGPILIEYGEKACASCEDMINNIIKPYFNLQFDETISFETDVNAHNLSFKYIYIYIDDPSTPQERIDAYDVYDTEHIKAFPMFTIITIEYDHSGQIKPFFVSLYGKFEPNDNYAKMIETFTELIVFSMEMWDRNIPGYEK